MQLLLFLSAILTALTGAVTGRASAPQQLASAAMAVEAKVATIAARRLPVRSYLALATPPLPEPPLLRAFAPLPAVALYAERRRE